MHWANLPAKLKAYIVLLALAAVPLIIWAILDLHTKPPADTGWLVLTGLVLATVPFFLFLPSVNATIGIGDSCIMAIAMLYGVSPCVIATFCHTVITSIFARRRPSIHLYQIIFNTSSMVCAAWIYSNIYHLLNPGQSTQIQDIILPAAVLTATFFLLNSLLTSTAMSWAVGDRVFGFWTRNCLPLAIDFSVSSVIGTLIVSLSHINRYMPLGAAPLIMVGWGWNKINKARAMEAERHLKDQEQLYLRTVESLALAVDAKDQTTYGHIRRVRAYALRLAKLCGITNSDELKAIETGSLLHDIGKLAIDDYLLNKPGRLSKQEFEKMKLHAAAGDEILQEVRFPFPVAQYVRCHHEQWDGLGYPDGLKGEQIPLGARILTIADAFDAIRSSRPYKVSFGVQDSIELLRAKAGKRFDPHLVDLFITHIDELVAAAEEAANNAPELAFRKYFEKVDRAISTADSDNSHLSPASMPSPELMEMFEFCISLGRHLDLPDFLHILARRLSDLLPFSTCAVYLDNGDDTLIAAHVSGKHSQWLQNLRISMGKGISGWVAAYRRPMINTSPALEFQEVSGDFSSLADTLIIPLVAEGECMGTISLYVDAPTVYTFTHLDLLQTLASIVAPTLAEIRSRKPLMEKTDIIDPVTQTHRAMYLSISGSQLISSAEQNQSPLSLLCVDIKDYQQLVCLYGTHTGDAILRKAANTLKTELRETDILVRYGHQGFAALLPGVRKEKALRCAQRLQSQIRTGIVNSITGHSIPINCQAGVASYPGDGSTTFALLQSAQRAMLDQAHVPDSADKEAAANIIEFLPRA